ncbi:MAG TPA: SpoIIE family protein phosphatase [Bryobacteraceae bacterium]|jgi:sigma-B regulation protein RsbU (phosphoserine phosphatase)|nr:SpoIIE family protein phosphatase [Bryobacteraceae bacterium]
MAIPRKASVRFRERAELLDFLLEVSRVTSETLDLDKLLANVGSIVKDVISYDLFAILLYNEREKGLNIRYSIGHREEIVRSLIIRLDEGVTGAAAATRLPVMVEDVRQDPRYLNALDAVRSELAVPMLARGKLVGVIDVQSTRIKAYSEQDRAMLRLIGARVAFAIDNARLYRRVERQNRTLRTLTHLSQEFSSILDLDELLTKIAATVRTLINYDAFSIYLVDAEKRLLRSRFSVRFDQRVTVDNIPIGKGITGTAAESREAIRVTNTSLDPRYIESHADVRSELATPLIVQDRVVGVLDVESERLAFFTEDHQRTLSLLAPQIASSVENARLYEEIALREQRMDQDLKAARKLQHVLQPRHAEIHGLDIAIRSRPAREISGDVYDFFENGDEYAVIAFGDVSGKGAAAALYGALVSGLLRILAPRKRSPALLMKSLNETLLERKVDAQYATLTLALWEPKLRQFKLTNAGAEPPFIYRNGEIIKPRTEGVPIGLLEDREYDEVVHQAEQGDLMLFFSDGVEDQLNAKEEDFTRSRVARLLKKHGTGEPKALADAIFADIDAFRDGTPITDDQSVVVIKVH